MHIYIYIYIHIWSTYRKILMNSIVTGHITRLIGRWTLI